jgi:hypothetical protein
MRTVNGPSVQRGVVLIFTLVILLLMSFLASSLYENHLLQLRMAGNEQARSEAMQGALALVDGVVAIESNFLIRGSEGYTFCPQGLSNESCDEANLVLDLAVPQDESYRAYSLQRRPPLEALLPVMDEDRASSGRHYRTALFEINASVRTPVGQGVAVHQGFMVRFPAPPHGGPR